MSKTDKIRLQHILDATNKTLAFTQNKTRTDLDTDEMLMLAVVRLIEIIGEAAKNVTEVTKDKYPDIPWRQMAGTRDRLSHAYFDVNLDIIWHIVANELPFLVNRIEGILNIDDKEI